MAIFGDLVTTAFELPRQRVVQNLGIARGIVVRYDATDIAPGVTEVLAYGSAVRVEAAT